MPCDKKRGAIPRGGRESREAATLREENWLLREQVKDYIALQKQNERLEKSRDYWQGQTKRTQRVTTDEKAVTAAAKRLIRNYGADIAVEDMLVDDLARCAATSEIPLGILTAFVGAPLFLYLIIKGGARRAA